MGDGLLQDAATSTGTDSRPLRPDVSLGRSDLVSQWQDVRGVPVSMHYVTGYLTSLDGSRTWMAMRSTMGGKARKLTLFELEEDGGFGDPPARDDAYGGPVESGCRDGVWGEWRPNGSALIETTETTIGWHEDDLLDVRGRLLGEPPRMFVPHHEAPFGYSLRWFAVEGTVGGVEVTGTACLDVVHLPHGVSLMVTPYLTVGQIAWTEFCTEYDDGTFDCGALLYGREGFCAMLILAGDGRVLTTTEVSAQFASDGRDPEFPATVRYSGGGEEWVVEAAPDGGRWPLRTDLPDGHRIVRIVAKRVGDTRRVVRACGFVEGYMERM